MGKFSRLSKSGKGKHDSGSNDRKHGEPAATDIAKGQSKEEIIQNSANVLDKSGDPEFSKGGKFDKLKNFSSNSMERQMYRQQMRREIGNGGAGINPMMMNQMNGSMMDMTAAGAAAAGMSKLGGAGILMQGVEIVKDGTRMVTSLAKGDFKGMASAAMELKGDFQRNGISSMTDSVGMLHNSNMLGNVSPATWQQMGKMDDGSMASRMGFSPMAAAANPMIAQNAMMAQFAPGSGVPAGWGNQPKEGMGALGKLAIAGGLATAGYVALQNKEDVKEGLDKILDPDGNGYSGDLASDTGKMLSDMAGKALDLPGQIKDTAEKAVDVGGKALSLPGKAADNFEPATEKLAKILDGGTSRDSDMAPSTTNNPYDLPKSKSAEKEGPEL